MKVMGETRKARERETHKKPLTVAFELEATEGGGGAELEERITSDGLAKHQSGKEKEKRKAWVSTELSNRWWSARIRSLHSKKLQTFSYFPLLWSLRETETETRTLVERSGLED